ncbi:uncharacterized protein LOC124370328 [Homalodisca vitripennis]|uniref:uncharacterized protein LOC124370328 n=1 Tax=Homalodisca vitripennis TaxID=197043 RepID=UPI001EEBDD53|nr:uncharacterized protein LOC124370328 [Homalodisca vitripennis]
MMEITDKNLNRIPEDASQGNIPNTNALKDFGTKDTTYAKTMLKELLRFDVHHRTEKDLREHVSRVHCLVRKCTSLKNLVAVTKDLLALRNTEVEQLCKNINIMEERIHLERNKQQNVLNTLSESARLNEDIKAQYHCQIEMFNDLRARYEEKVALLVAENTQLSELFAEQNINMVGDGMEGRHCNSPEETREKKQKGYGEGEVQLGVIMKPKGDNEENIATSGPEIIQSLQLTENIIDKEISEHTGQGEGETS